MRIERVRIRRVAAGEDPAAWAAALADPAWPAGATLLKSEGAAWVRRATLAGRDVTVKCRPLHTALRRVKSALRRGHADRQWRGAARLGAAGVRTATPRCAGAGECDGTACELLVLDYVPGPTVLQVMHDVAQGRGPGVRAQHRLAALVGTSVTTLLKGGLWNDDHKPSNLVVTGEGPGAEIAVIDCVGVRRYGALGVDVDDAEHMFAALLIEPAGCGCRPRAALRLRALRAAMGPGPLAGSRAERHAAMWEVMRTVGVIVGAHGDPTPKVNPLAAPAQAPNGA